MPSAIHLHQACRALAAGGVIAYPTEAVWGLGCEPLNRHAFARLVALKRRPLHKGVILIASDFAQLESFVALPRARLAPALKTWPGPHTWIVPAAARVPGYLTGGRGTLAVRVTAHPLAAALCDAYGGAVVSTSANISGRPPARTVLQVRRAFGATLDCILAGDTGGLARPTSIHDLASGAKVRA